MVGNGCLLPLKKVLFTLKKEPKDLVIIVTLNRVEES